MELEEIKAFWSDLTSELRAQKKLTRELILKMAHEKSSSRLGRIIKAEALGITLSAVILVYLTLNVNRLEHWTGMVGAIGLFAILLLGIGFGGRIIQKARMIDLINNPVAEVIRHFDEFRALLRVYKKFGIWTSLFSVLFVIPVTTELFLDKNVMELEGLGKALVASLIIVPLVFQLIKRFYSRNVSAVKKELNNLDLKD